MNDDIAEKYGDIVQTLLRNRNLHTIEEVENFISPAYDTNLYSPFLLKGMIDAVRMIIDVLSKNEKIVIYGDYDCDGIPGSTLLYNFLSDIGAHVDVYIPHRHKEGYGLRKEVLGRLKNEGVSLVITVDLGITAIEEAEFAKEIGLKLIITDHHLPVVHIEGENILQRIPSADIVINTKQHDCAYPDKNLCGAATAWKLTCALCEYANEHPEIAECKRILSLPTGYLKWLLDLVAISTIADMVPLVGENRVLAKYGLLVLNKTRRPGLLALCKISGITLGSITEDDIAFSIAPRINAASRMDEGLLAFKLLICTDTQAATLIAKQLDSLNSARKTNVTQIMKRLNDELKHRTFGDIVVVGSTEWSPGILGLIASKLIEQYKKTVFVWGAGDDAQSLKGSCRSTGDVSVVDLMNEAPTGTFLHTGGHEMAGGFSISPSKVMSLETILSETYTHVARLPQAEDIIAVELHLPPLSIQKELSKHIDTLRPYGVQNPKPLIRVSCVTVQNVSLFGKNKEHIKWFSKTSKNVEYVLFFKPHDVHIQELDSITVLGNIESSNFRGKNTIRFRVIQILAS